MRPQRFSCGISRMKFAKFLAALASMRPQRFSCGISASATAGADSALGFNEAAAFQLRNRRGDVDDRHASDRASMRPQRFSCGIRVAPNPTAPARLCFNEAAAFQLRNRAVRAITQAADSCFNEAAAFQLRNRAACKPACRMGFSNRLRDLPKIASPCGHGLFARGREQNTNP